MVPPIRYYLVGGWLRDDSSRKDVDIVGVMNRVDFDLTFGYTHESLQEAYKQDRDDKFKRYALCNTITGYLLSYMLKKKVDFKWIPESMLYKPNVELHLEADLTSYL